MRLMNPDSTAPNPASDPCLSGNASIRMRTAGASGAIESRLTPDERSDSPKTTRSSRRSKGRRRLPPAALLLRGCGKEHCACKGNDAADIPRVFVHT